jgi:PAS domain S-box-containing protein
MHAKQLPPDPAIMRETPLQSINQDLEAPLSAVSQDQLQFLQYLWEGVSYGIFVLDVLDEGRDFRYTAFNPAMIRTSPIAIEQLLGKTVTAALSEEMAQLYGKRYSDCVYSAQSISFEEHFCHNGQETWWLVTVNPLRDRNTQIVDRLIVTAIDVSDRKQTEIALAESEAKFRRVIEDANDVIGIWGLDGILTYLSPGFRTIFDYEPSEWLGQSFVPLVHPDDLHICIEANQQVVETGEKRSGVEFRNRHQNGHWVWVSMNVSPVKDTDGKVIGFQGILRDISDRQQAQKEQARLLAILAATSDFVGSADPTGQVLYLNQSARKMLGLTPEDAIANRNITQSHPEWVNQLLASEALPETMRSGSWLGETAILGKNGSEIPVSQLILAHRSETGEMEYFSTISRDISDRKRQENALRFIVEGTVSKTGEAFFHTCMQHLAEIFQVQYAFITESVDETFTKSRMLALWTGEGFVEPYEFNLAGTPCAVVFQDNWGIFPDELQARFPEAEALAILNAESYLGVAIVDSQGKAIGNLGIIDTKPLIDNLNTAKFILQIFASRVGAEMERYAAEVKLQEKEQFLRTVYEGANQPIFVIDILSDGEFRYVGWNVAAEAASGMRSQDISGKTPEEIYGIEAGKLQRQRLQKCLVSGNSVSYEECLTFNGKESWWITTHNPIQDSHGKIYRFIGTTFDISDRKAAEKQLRQNEQKYHQILDAITDMVLVKGSQSRIAWANKAFRDYYAMTNEQLQDMIDAPFNEPDYTLQYIRDDAYVFETGKSLEIEEPVTRYDGKVQLFNTIKSVIRNEAGEKILTVGVSRDISDRKAAEAALSEYANRQTLLNQLVNQIRNSLDLDAVIATTIQSIRNLMEIDHCAFVWYKSDVKPPMWNMIQEAKLEDIPSGVGFYPSTLVGPIEELLLNQETLRIDNVEHYEEPIHKAFLQTIQAKSEILLPIRTHSNQIGAIVCVHHRQVRPWTESEVELLKAVSNQLAIAIDQAEMYAESRAKSEELEQTLQELQRTQAKMLQSEKMSSLGQLVAGIAHEINNPVNFIHGNITHAGSYAQELLALMVLYQQTYPHPTSAIAAKIQNIDLEFISQDLPKLLTSMKVGTERIREIVKSLRLFSRLDESEVKPVDIHDGIDSTLMILQSRIKARPDRAEIQIVKEYGNLPEVECFAGQLNQVFMNILVNAIDALEEQERRISPHKQKQHPSIIRIITEMTPNNQAVIRITDNGPGIPESLQNRIFDPFFTTKPVGKGTGMGMSISYQIIIEKHGGQLLCCSTPGGGTEFVIQIPIQQHPELS